MKLNETVLGLILFGIICLILALIVTVDVDQPYCGDANCNIDLNETILTCPQDCYFRGDDVNETTEFLVLVDLSTEK